MATALKDIYNKEFLQNFANKVHSVYEAFDIEGFIATIVDNTWDELKLKARIRRISETLGVYLPENYKEALEVLFAIDEFCIGFPYLFFPDFVEVYGQGHENLNLSIKALERFTIRSSSEFAVRAFIKSNPKLMMDKMLDWSKSDNEHVRRLASEGCRPRLPWGDALTIFKKDPTLVLSVLEQLKDDISPYVRKSVANNLNDISKDNPHIILEVVKHWKGVHPYTDWILRHGCRTLIRKADSEIMRLFGYAQSTDQPLISSATLSVNPSILKIGQNCQINYEIFISEGEPVHIRIEYGIDFVKVRGNTSRKTFLLADKTVEGGQCITGSRKHSWRQLTTRCHYPGTHGIVLLVNGCEIALTSMKLDL